MGPFGNPDGSGAGIKDLISEFVDFGGNPAYGHLATRANDSMVRVIVGIIGPPCASESAADRAHNPACDGHLAVIPQPNSRDAYAQS